MNKQELINLINWRIKEYEKESFDPDNIELLQIWFKGRKDELEDILKYVEGLK